MTLLIGGCGISISEKIDTRASYRCGDPADNRSPHISGAALEQMLENSGKENSHISVQDGRVYIFDSASSHMTVCYPPEKYAHL